MTILLLAVFCSGLFFSKTLYELGMISMLPRYLIAVCASYAFFFSLMKLWLWYITDSPKNEWSVSDVDVANAGDAAIDAVQGTASVIREAGRAPLGGHGGDFGGAGASDPWGSAITSRPMASGTSSSGSGSGTASGAFDLGDEAIVLIALVALLFAIFGAGAYLVWAAPSILSESAFQAFLAAGLIKASRKITRRGWMGSVLRATCVPFLIVLLMTGIFGWVAHDYFPQATKLSDIFGPIKFEDR
jgi:hypothetical protein